jgi:hypothetical protein
VREAVVGEGEVGRLHRSVRAGHIACPPPVVSPPGWS